MRNRHFSRARVVSSADSGIIPALDCTAGYVHDRVLTTLFHLVPIPDAHTLVRSEEQDYFHVGHAFCDDIAELSGRNSGFPIRGLLTGGDQSKASGELRGHIGRSLTESGVSPTRVTRVWGIRGNGSARLMYQGGDDIACLHLQGEDRRPESALTTWRALKERVIDLYVAPGDHLVFPGSGEYDRIVRRLPGLGGVRPQSRAA